MYASSPHIRQSSMTRAEQHRRVHLAELSAAKRAEASAPQTARLGARRRVTLGIPRMRVLLHLG